MRQIENTVWYLEKGTDRTRVCLTGWSLGEDVLAYIYNDSPHLGAVAVGEFDSRTNRASTSLITVLGHKDDAIALQAAHLISRHTQRPVCVIAGVHVEAITQEEIASILQNAELLVQEFVQEKLQGL